MFRQIMQITVFMASLIARHPISVKRSAACKHSRLSKGFRGHGFVMIRLI
ncbi:hypothetical protein N182_16675 [Sinorhizobium sp. GL2]|nr:hypothetical protein N182_16675 [Sinorhizobium sp. GL2]